MKFFAYSRNRFLLAPSGLMVLCLTTASNAAPPVAEISLAPKSVLRFATQRETAETLTAKDDYLSRLSLRDRQIRMRKQGEISTEEFSRFLAGEALDWKAEQIEKLTPILKSLAARIGELKLPLPETVLLGLTSGREEDDAAYTRGNMIVLSRSKVAGSSPSLERLLAHELFHVLSRHNPELRQRLYAIVGFQPCGEIALPESLALRTLHNPDAPVADYCIDLRHEGMNVTAVPILLAAAERPGASAPTNLFRALEFRMLVIEKADARWRPKLTATGEPILFDPKGNDSYSAKIGRNTAYIIHPEEILADNFMHLVMGTKNLPNPEIIERLRQELTREPGK